MQRLDEQELEQFRREALTLTPERPAEKWWRDQDFQFVCAWVGLFVLMHLIDPLVALFR